jgi:RsiW-degrading membrane proteinase PrsW (M82 family)
MAAQPAALPARRSRGRGRLISLITLTLVCVLGILGVLFLAVRGSGETEGAALSLGFALAPVPLVVGAFLWLDRYQPEPLRYLVDLTDTELATFVAPLTEEPAKAAFLIVILLRRRRELDGVVDGLVYAGLVGVGFAFTENVGYYAGAYGGRLAPELSGPEATTGLFIIRGLFSPFTHSLFAAAFGLGVGLAVLAHKRWVRWLAPSLGLLAAIALHGLWNGSVSYFGGGGFLLVYVLMMVPTFIAFVVIAAVARRSEGRILVRALTDAAGRGWLHPDEVPYLASFPLRASARRFAKNVAGDGAGRAVKAYQSAATRMAFQHDRLLRGRPTPDGIARVADELNRMSAARPWVVLPPPLRLSSAPALPPSYWSGAPRPAPQGYGAPPPRPHAPPGSHPQSPQQHSRYYPPRPR